MGRLGAEACTEYGEGLVTESLILCVGRYLREKMAEKRGMQYHFTNGYYIMKWICLVISDWGLMRPWED